ncbi:MAG: hypothetical protein RDV48_17165 [Candidatus Eremiobacteraeota bacterium]|nr:hypothetical protein [Candidatus Eremiobacteraeota bacterium]
MKKILLLLSVIMVIFLAGAASGQDKFYDFRMGPYPVDGGNTLEFSFPSETMDTLYCFNLKEWKGTRPAKCRLTVKLYNRSKVLMATGESVSITSAYPSFGSIAFRGITRELAKDVAYFTYAVAESQ